MHLLANAPARSSGVFRLPAPRSRLGPCSKVAICRPANASTPAPNPLQLFRRPIRRRRTVAARNRSNSCLRRRRRRLVAGWLPFLRPRLFQRAPRGAQKAQVLDPRLWFARPSCFLLPVPTGAQPPEEKSVSRRAAAPIPLPPGGDPLPTAAPLEPPRGGSCTSWRADLLPLGGGRVRAIDRAPDQMRADRSAAPSGRHFLFAPGNSSWAIGSWPLGGAGNKCPPTLGGSSAGARGGPLSRRRRPSDRRERVRAARRRKEQSVGAARRRVGRPAGSRRICCAHLEVASVCLLLLLLALSHFGARFERASCAILCKASRLALSGGGPPSVWPLVGGRLAQVACCATLAGQCATGSRARRTSGRRGRRCCACRCWPAQVWPSQRRRERAGAS